MAEADQVEFAVAAWILTFYTSDWRHHGGEKAVKKLARSSRACAATALNFASQNQIDFHGQVLQRQARMF